LAGLQSSAVRAFLIDALLDYFEGGQTLDEFLDDFPTVSRTVAIAALESAKSLLVSQIG
jgi:uncharacterized protein (DUF433 family)